MAIDLLYMRTLFFLLLFIRPIMELTIINMKNRKILGGNIFVDLPV